MIAQKNAIENMQEYLYAQSEIEKGQQNGGKTTQTKEEKLHLPIITGCKMQQSKPMVDTNAHVVENPNHCSSILTTLTMMAEVTEKNFTQREYRQADMDSINGLETTITPRDSKFSVVTAIMVNIAIRVFALIKARRCNDYPQGVGSSDPKRTALLMGEDIVLSLGQPKAALIKGGYGITNHNENKCFDFGNQLGVAAGLIFGVKKSVFNSADFSTITLSSYSPAP